MSERPSPDPVFQRIKTETRQELKKILEELRAHSTGFVDVAAAGGGSAVGAAASGGALYYAGSVVGFSAPGLSSGLAGLGALVGGGMLAGIGVVTVPVAIGGIVGHTIAKKRRSARLAAALRTAIERLYVIQERLMANAEYFQEELAEIKARIEQLERQKAKERP